MSDDHFDDDYNSHSDHDSDSDGSYYDAENDIYYHRKNIKKSSVKITDLPDEMLENICYYLSQKDITSLLSTDKKTSQLHQELNLRSRRELSQKLYEFPYHKINYKFYNSSEFKDFSFENLTISEEYLTKDSPIIIKINHRKQYVYLVITRNYFMITRVDYENIFNENYSYLWKKVKRINEKVVISIYNTKNNNNISLIIDGEVENQLIFFHSQKPPLDLTCFMISPNSITLETYYDFNSTGLLKHISDQNPYYHYLRNGKMLIVTPSYIKLIDEKTCLLHQTEKITVEKLIKLNELIVNQTNVRDFIIKIDDRKYKYFLTIYTDQNRFTFEEKNE